MKTEIPKWPKGTKKLLAAEYKNTADDCLYLSNAMNDLARGGIRHEVRESPNGRELWRDSHGMRFDKEAP